MCNISARISGFNFRMRKHYVKNRALLQPSNFLYGSSTDSQIFFLFSNWSKNHNNFWRKLSSRQRAFQCQLFLHWSISICRIHYFDRRNWVHRNPRFPYRHKMQPIYPKHCNPSKIFGANWISQLYINNNDTKFHAFAYVKIAHQNGKHLNVSMIGTVGQHGHKMSVVQILFQLIHQIRCKSIGFNN